MPIRVSVIAPLFNEEQGIPRLAEKLARLREQLGPKYELECVLVDDGSRDQTWEAVESCFANTPQIVKVAHDCNRGLGAAMRTGFRNATGSIVCTIDADCTFDPLELPKFLAAMEEGNADIATGSPYHPKGGVENVVPWRLFLSQGASKIYRVICRGKLYSYTSLMRAYRRDVVERISFASDGFVAVTEILLRALNEGYRVVEVPMVLRRRATGVSKMNVARNILAHLVLASRVLVWRFLPLGPPASGLRPKQNVNQ
jgi:dolichol-phosphate mannosyltransferase